MNNQVHGMASGKLTSLIISIRPLTHTCGWEQKYESTKHVTHSVDNFVRVNLASLKMIKTVIIIGAVIACINAEVNFDKFKYL